MKSFLEMWKLIETEELGTSNPVPLSKITPQLAKTAVISGQKDANPNDDKAKGAKPEDTVAVGSLLPMQKEVIPSKALGMAIGFLLGRGPDLNDMEAIVSNDNYIMDGHHRWAAATLIDPNRMVKVARVGLPASQLVTALNLWTKAQGRSGNPGKGDIAQFSATIQSLVDKIINEGIPDQTDKDGKKIPGFSSEEVKQALGKVVGANGDPNQGANLMKQNASKLPTQKHPQAPERVDMPVVNGKAEINDVIQKLIKGDIDWNLPLSRDTQIAKTNIGSGTGQDKSGNVPSMSNTTQQKVGGSAGSSPGSFQMNVASNQAMQKPIQNFPQPNQQRQVASTENKGPSLNEWLILSGIKND